MNSESTLTISRASEPDFPHIVELLKATLPPGQQADGYLSKYFDLRMLQAVNEHLAILVCKDGSKLVGFLGLTTPGFKHSNEVAIAMLEVIRHGELLGKSYDEWRVCLCGPVCVDREYRGAHVFSHLYEKIPDYAKGLTLQLTMIATESTGSIAAHEKVGMMKVGDFDWYDRAFTILAKPM